MEQYAWYSKNRNLKVNGCFPRVPPRKTWNDVIRRDLKERNLSKDLVKDRNA